MAETEVGTVEGGPALDGPGMAELARNLEKLLLEANLDCSCVHLLRLVARRDVTGEKL